MYCLHQLNGFKLFVLIGFMRKGDKKNVIVYYFSFMLFY